MSGLIARERGSPASSHISLVPHSGIQFAQFELQRNEIQFVYRRFLEEEVVIAGQATRVLHALALDDGTLYHPITKRPLKLDDTAFLSGQQGLEPYLGAWLPLPFLRLDTRAADGTPVYGAGPANWVRAFVTRDAGKGAGAPAGYTIVLAFDTAVAMRAAGGSAPACPTSEDVKEGKGFALTDRAEHVASFLSEPWVDEWLRRQCGAHRASLPSGTDAETRSWTGAKSLQLDHVARYLTYLSVLSRACGALEARFVDTLSQDRLPACMDVDLVLDVGNSRTSGALVEVAGEAASPSAGGVRPIEMRDLSRPWLVHPAPIESRLEFARPQFGDAALSRRSGRGNAFLWPSLVRIGAEAIWLASGPASREGTTGLSSLKRYVTDTLSSDEAWRFSAGSGAEALGAVVSGPVLAHLNERGDVLRQGSTNQQPAVRPRFSRSALFGLFIAELLLQSISRLNAPVQASSVDGARLPRRLRRIVLTMPFNVAAEERETMGQRLRDAVDLIWQSCGWTEIGSALLQKPVVEFGFDEAMSAQFVFLFNEIKEKLNASAAEYVEMIGRSRPELGALAALRIASIDIGGGSTGLTIVTYAPAEHGAIAPRVAHSARIHHGGDDVLRSLISAVLMPAIASELQSRGLDDAAGFVHEALGVAVAGLDPDDRFARRFMAQYAQPVALAILKDYQALRPGARHTIRSVTLGGLAARAAGIGGSVAEEVDTLAAQMGAVGFKLAETEIVIRPAAISAAIRTVLGPVLGEHLAVVDAFDCDQVLLTGWMSQLPDVMDIALERLPDRPERIVPMHSYDVAGWYPFARASGRIGDPKSTAVAGALLAQRTSGLVAGVSLRLHDLAAPATIQLGSLDSAMAGQRAIGAAVPAPVRVDTSPQPHPGEVSAVLLASSEVGAPAAAGQGPGRSAS